MGGEKTASYTPYSATNYTPIVGVGFIRWVRVQLTRPHITLSGCRRDQGTYCKSFICWFLRWHNPVHDSAIWVMMSGRGWLLLIGPTYQEMALESILHLDHLLLAMPLASACRKTHSRRRNQYVRKRRVPFSRGAPSGVTGRWKRGP